MLEKSSQDRVNMNRNTVTTAMLVIWVHCALAQMQGKSACYYNIQLGQYILFSETEFTRSAIHLIIHSNLSI